MERQPGYPLQVLPGLEGTILKAMLHDLLGIVFTDALNDHQFLLSSSVQIHVFRHNLSFQCKLFCDVSEQAIRSPDRLTLEIANSPV